MTYIKKCNEHVCKNAFTLAEVLITIGIIGVIASIVIPVINSKIEKIRAYNQLQKAYANLSQIASQIRNENGGDFNGLISESSITQNLDFTNLFKPYMSIMKFCQDSTDSPKCYTKNTDITLNLQGGALGGYSTTNYYKDRPKIVTTDGFVYMFGILSTDCSSNKYKRNGNNESCGSVAVDINGVKLPNRLGADIFGFSVNKYNLTPYTDMQTGVVRNDIYCSSSGSDSYNGCGCAYRAIREGGIYY